MSYERKIFAGLMTAIFAFLPLVGLSIFTIQRLINDESAIIEANSRQALLIERLQFFNARQDAQIPIYLLSRDRKELDRFHEFHSLLLGVIDQLLAIDEDPAERAVIESLRKKTQEVFVYVEPGTRILRDENSVESADRYFRRTAMPLNDEISSLAQQLAITSRDRGAKASAEMRQSIFRLELGIGVLAGLAIALSAWACTLFVKVSRQKRIVDEQTARISQARKEAVEVVAHDLKNPLSTIIMSTEMLEGEDYSFGAGDAEIRAGLDMTKRAARSMQGLIHSLLDHAKIEAGALVLEPEQCDPASLLEDVHARFQLLAEARGITLKRVIEGRLPMLSADCLRLDQVFSNLLGNALKFTPAGGNVTLGARLVGTNVVFSVKDTGAGISKEQAAHVFDRYWQVRATSAQGTGLGLSIAQAIVQAHEGRIWLDSEPGRGTTFFFALPAPAPAVFSATGTRAKNEFAPV